ncbi:MAG TPA: LysR family transcriptional regulator [Polyangiaceae bacterium]|nr:LysR family transcriptional regulator [Polyangiaceae bacterium]
MHIPWDAVELFLAIADRRSLAQAAKQLGVTQPTVSRRLADVEATLGEPLFLRSVEGVSLTAAGERLIEPARRMAESHGELERVASGGDASPRGEVCITAPPGIAFELLAPFAVFLRRTLPEVRLAVDASIRQVDLVRREADLALRASQPATRDLVTLASLEEPIAAFASAGYAKKVPERPSFADVDWVAWPSTHSDVPPNPQLAALIPDFAPAFAANDFLVQLHAAEHGAGAILLSRAVSRLARPSPLVELPIDFGPVRAGIHLVCARSSLAIARVRAVAELLAAELRPEARVPRARARRPAVEKPPARSPR